MAQNYQLTGIRRMVNQLIRALVSVNLAPRSTYLLTTTGCKSGQPRTTPVTLVENAGGRWLVAPYGPVAWVHNVRATPQVVLRRGRTSLNLAATELPPAEAAPILRTYVKGVAVTRPYFDVTPDSSIEEFEHEGPRHPVFCLQ
jgi:deazaflavin-dependent oxidoreductase (nitroreductase family)